MSLINEVLREVDQRRGAARAEAEASSSPVAARARRRPALLALLAVAALAAPLAWWLLPERPDGSSAPAQIADQSPAPAAPTDPPAAVARSQPSQAVPGPAPDSAPPGPSLASAPEPAPEPLPASATQPDPTPVAATSRPAGAATAGSAAPAPSPPLAATFSPPLPETVSTAPVAAAEPPAQARITAAATRRTAAAEGDRPSGASESEPSPQISIQRADRPAAAADPFEEARRALSRGQTGLAEDRLRALLRDESDHTEARRLLATILANTGRGNDAVHLLEQGLAQHSSPALAGLLARLLAERGEIGRALGILETHAPALTEDLDYHLLHAALLRQSGQHAAALDHYRALTESAPASAAAWVGLAASHEALDQTDAARTAYQQALRFDQAELAAFARARLRALN